jgi:hypothetical protein
MKRVIVFYVLLGGVPLVGQPVADGPASTQPATTQPASPATALKARVLETAGTVAWATTGADVLDADAWTPVKVDDEFGGGVQIRTGLRSHVTLQFGDDTVVSVRRATLASIDQFYRTEAAKSVRLGLGYGAIRGGTTEGELRSDLTVESPVATLAKRGTEGWEIFVEPYTGGWRISLARAGLVEALERGTGQRRLVYPGQYANARNIAQAWINQALFDRVVQFVPADMLTPAEVDFTTHVRGGIAPIALGGAADLLDFAGRTRPPTYSAADLARLSALSGSLNTVLVTPRPEGNFGVPAVQFLIDAGELRRLRRR